jgi:hypothetical protein
VSTVIAHAVSFAFGFIAARLDLPFPDLIAAALLAVSVWMLVEWRLFDTMRRETWGSASDWNLKAASMVGVIFSGHAAAALGLMSMSYWPTRLLMHATP